MIHPTTKLIWDAMDSLKIPPAAMYGYLRLFIAHEYNRDNSVAERLTEALQEVAEAHADLEKPEYPDAFETVDITKDALVEWQGDDENGICVANACEGTCVLRLGHLRIEMTDAQEEALRFYFNET